MVYQLRAPLVRLLVAALFVSSAGLINATEAVAADAAPSRGRPNIVIILADDLGYGDLGFQGGRDIPTPNLDALAARGVRCTHGYVSGPYCSPTRAGLLTGRYQQRFGHEFNPGGERTNTAIGLPLSETTIADRLKQAGYATGLVGKWHLGAAAKFHPQRRGFDEFFGFLGGAHGYFPDRQAAPILRGTQRVEEPEYLTDAFAREAVAFIDRHKQEPFFLYLAFNAVHTPMHATDARLERFRDIVDQRRRTYAAMTVAMDEAVGQVVHALEGTGSYDNTLVFFFSDNGGPTMRGTTINGSRNTPLRGSKRTTLEGGIRVPFVVSWPARLPAGKTYEQPVIQLDIQPTALAAADVAVQADWKLDGVNLLPHLTGEASNAPHDNLYWRMGEQTALRHGDWKLVRYDPTADGWSRQAPWTTKLYNLADDIGEAKDLADSQPERVKELSKIWEAWSDQLARPLWGPGSVTAGSD